MNRKLVQEIKSNPNYKELVSKRTALSVKLSIAMLSVYFTFILTIAFNPILLGTPLSKDSVITVGIPIGIAIILFAFMLTGIYTFKANGEFDDLTNKLKQDIGEK